MSKKYFVKKGRSIITGVGIKNEGEEITADMFLNKEETIENLISSSKCPIDIVDPKKESKKSRKKDSEKEEKKEENIFDNDYGIKRNESN